MVGIISGTAKVLFAVILLPLYNSDVHILRTRLLYSMYEIRDHQDPVKGSGWVLFPSTMAKQPIQQMVVGHLCFQERAEQ